MRALFILMLAGAPLAAQMATVEGKVTEMGSGHAVRKAEVILRGLTRTGDPPEPDNYAAETDANGHFLIEGIVPGKYQATSSHAGFITRLAGKPMQPATFAQLTLAAGAHATVDLKLIGTGVISGRTIPLNGEIVPGAYVEALQYSYPVRAESPPGAVMAVLPGDGRKQLESRGGSISNERGEFRIFGLAPGQYYLRVLEMERRETAIECTSLCAPEEELRGPRPPMGFATVYYPSAPDFARATPLEVVSGGELRNIEIRLHPQSIYSIRATAPGAHGGITWELRSRGESTRSDFSTGADSDNFQFNDLLPGSYVVSATSQDPEHPNQSFYARQVVEILDHDVDGVTLLLAPMKTVTGTVKAEGPLAVRFSGMSVELDPDSPGAPSATARVNADGAFTAEVLPEPYTLVRPSIATAYIKSVKMGDRELAGPNIDFARLDGPLTIVLGADAGRVEGTAAMGAKITLIPSGAGANWPGRLKMVNADENGKFAFPVVAPGEYKLFAWQDADSGAPFDPEFRKPYDSQGVNVKVEPNGRSSVQLPVIVTGK